VVVVAGSDGGVVVVEATVLVVVDFVVEAGIGVVDLVVDWVGMTTAGQPAGTGILHSFCAPRSQVSIAPGHAGLQDETSKNPRAMQSSAVQSSPFFKLHAIQSHSEIVDDSSPVFAQTSPLFRGSQDVGDVVVVVPGGGVGTKQPGGNGTLQRLLVLRSKSAMQTPWPPGHVGLQLCASVRCKLRQSDETQGLCSPSIFSLASQSSQSQEHRVVVAPEPTHTSPAFSGEQSKVMIVVVDVVCNVTGGQPAGTGTTQ